MAICCRPFHGMNYIFLEQIAHLGVLLIRFALATSRICANSVQNILETEKGNLRYLYKFHRLNTSPPLPWSISTVLQSRGFISLVGFHTAHSTLNMLYRNKAALNSIIRFQSRDLLARSRQSEQITYSFWRGRWSLLYWSLAVHEMLVGWMGGW